MSGLVGGGGRDWARFISRPLRSYGSSLPGPRGKAHGARLNQGGSIGQSVFVHGDGQASLEERATIPPTTPSREHLERRQADFTREDGIVIDLQIYLALVL